MNTVIVDYGMGNLRSIQHKLKRIGVEAVVSSSSWDVENADLLIFPGVGHFAKGMHNLKEYGLLDVLHWKVKEAKMPVLGICLGMQLFTRRSEEGDVDGLGWIDAETRRFCFAPGIGLKIPHVGWNLLNPRRLSPILEGVRSDQRFYFVHSYHVVCNSPDDVLTTTEYGYRFVSSVHRGNIFGVQFHPEKSHEEGMTVIRNFFDMFQARQGKS